MSFSTKTLVLTCTVLMATITGITAGFLAKIDGGTTPAALRAAAIGFGSSLSLALAVLTAYTLL
ncbi:hypothetical protein [Nocardia takedensis]|uniref:hypothetical protein n=1 Tax=Nocardia takedensis TaxID=259390 RepID=UPI0005935DB7|nr:hypothetical protein [Nocardia takedensis]